MSTTRITISNSDQRLASSIQFVSSHDRGIALRKHSSPLAMLVYSSSTSDNRTDSSGSSIYLLQLSSEFADPFSSPGAECEVFTLLACWPVFNGLDHHSPIECSPLFHPPLSRSCFQQCIWCCEIELQRDAPVHPCRVRDDSMTGPAEGMVIVQQLCDRCRLQLIDRIRQNILT